MKQPLALIILFFLCSFMLTDTKHVETDLYGKVKQIIETADQAVFENGHYRTLTNDDIPKFKKIKSYNKRGELVEMSVLIQGQLMSRVEIKYDSKGQMKSQNHYNNAGQITASVERTSDSTTVRRDTRGLGTTVSTESMISPLVKREVSLNPQQELKSIATVTRDERYWILEVHNISIHNGDTVMNRTEYYKYIETDKEKNWTKCFVSTSTEFDSVQVKLREIEYY